MKRPKDMERFLAESCDEVTTIKGINNQYDYEDEHPQGDFDWKLVSCGQSEEDYNEIERIYEEKLKPLIDEEKITKDNAIKAICFACRNLDQPRTWKDFYEELQNYRSINLS